MYDCVATSPGHLVMSYWAGSTADKVQRIQ